MIPDGEGIEAAQAAAQRWRGERRSVRIMMPPQPGTDWADVLALRAPSGAEGSVVYA